MVCRWLQSFEAPVWLTADRIITRLVRGKSQTDARQIPPSIVFMSKFHDSRDSAVTAVRFPRHQTTPEAPQLSPVTYKPSPVPSQVSPVTSQPPPAPSQPSPVGPKASRETSRLTKRIQSRRFCEITPSPRRSSPKPSASSAAPASRRNSAKKPPISAAQG